MLECIFCQNYNFKQYERVLGAKTIDECIIYKTPNFVVLPDIAPLVEGHLIIVPLSHYVSYGGALIEHWQEFTELKAIVSELLIKVYSNCMFIEHGAAQDRKAGNSIDHAHLHCIPANIDLTSHTEVGKRWMRINSPKELCSFYIERKPYLFFESSSGQEFVHLVDEHVETLPSQYLRKVFADSMHQEWWDWREMITDDSYKYKNKEKVLQAMEKLKSGGESYGLASG